MGFNIGISGLGRFFDVFLKGFNIGISGHSRFLDEFSIGFNIMISGLCRFLDDFLMRFNMTIDLKNSRRAVRITTLCESAPRSISRCCEARARFTARQAKRGRDAGGAWFDAWGCVGYAEREFNDAVDDAWDGWGHSWEFGKCEG